MVIYWSMKRIGLVLAVVLAMHAAAPNRDFSGKWIYDSGHSNPGSLAAAPESSLTVSQDFHRITCSSLGGDAKYDLNGGDSKYRFGQETRNSAVKWEGAALLINTL